MGLLLGQVFALQQCALQDQRHPTTRCTRLASATLRRAGERARWAVCSSHGGSSPKDSYDNTSI